MSAQSWPGKVSVRHVPIGGATGAKRVILDCANGELTAAEARDVARELILRADYLDGVEGTYTDVHGVPHRRCTRCEGTRKETFSCMGEIMDVIACRPCGGKGYV